MKVLKTFALSAAMLVLGATAAFAQNPATPAEVKTEVLGEATPYFGWIVGIVIALFGAALLVVLAKKGARMARGAISRG